MFVHLHNHSEYSLLQGAIRIPQLVARAKEFGQPAVALTDYGNMFGAVDFFLETKGTGVKPVIGCVLYHPSNDQHTLRQHRRGIDHLFQLVILITNKTGYLNLCQLLSLGYLEGFYYKPRIDSALLEKYSEGLIALSGGWDGALNQYLFEGQKEKALEALKNYARIFPGRFYVELQENGIEGQHEMNLELLEMAKSFSVPVVATNNCHYLNRDDAEAFESLMCIQTGATVHGAGNQLKFSTDGYYFKTEAEMEADFAYVPEAVSNTVKIAELCHFEFDLKNYHFPKFTPPGGFTLDSYLREETLKGLEKRWPEILRNRKHTGPDKELREEYQRRFDEELEIIQKMGFSGYFLIVSDFIGYAKDNGIPVGPGRGSAAGSLVAYLTRITDLDPIPHKLLFERFLNPERISMPDVDIDFCMNGREEVLKYVAKKYGNVSQIITFGKMKAKAVLRDVGRVMEMPYDEVDRIAKLVPNQLNITLADALKQEPRLKELSETNPQVKRLIETALRLEGLNRHASTHAAGVVISDKPLTEFVPLYKGSNDDVVTQFDMKAIEKIGLIKFDFLGLKTLTIIQSALKIISRTRKEEIKLLEIPLDDPEVYTLLAKADTAGVFQLESSGMKDLMVRFKPGTFEDLVALVALYRPGPLGSGMVDDFINRKVAKTRITYDVPQLEPILNETYGVIVYQEQVMQIAAVLAGYSLGEADLLRRAMGKKKPAEMAKQKLRFMEGAEKNKIPRAKAEKIFDLMAKFAEYGFNKSHSAAYALVSYHTAYLKAHYPVEYLAAILTAEMHDTDRILYYIQDSEAHGIRILPPDVNEGYFGFSVIGEKEIRFGLGALKGVGEGAIESILESRKKLGRFESFFHFTENINHHKVNRRVIESMIKSGAFDSFHSSRAAFFAVIDQAVDLAVSKQKEVGSGQTNLFSGLEVGGKPVGLRLPEVSGWAENEKLAFEKEAMGFYFSGHPLKTYEAEIRRVASSDTKLCQTVSSQTEVKLAGMVTQTKVITTKKGARMAFLTFEDLKGTVEVIVFSDVYQKIADLLTQDVPMVLTGQVERGEEGAKIMAKEMIPLTECLNRQTQSVHFKIPAPLFTEDRMQGLNRILAEYPGACKAFIHLLIPGDTETVMELPKGVDLSSEKVVNRINVLFQEKIVEYRL